MSLFKLSSTFNHYRITIGSIFLHFHSGWWTALFQPSISWTQSHLWSTLLLGQDLNARLSIDWQSQRSSSILHSSLKFTCFFYNFIGINNQTWYLRYGRHNWAHMIWLWQKQILTGTSRVRHVKWASIITDTVSKKKTFFSPFFYWKSNLNLFIPFPRKSDCFLALDFTFADDFTFRPSSPALFFD